MVGYNRIPTKRLRADARFPRGAGQAKRRQPAASGDLSPPPPPAPLCSTPFSILATRFCRSPVPPSRPKPHRAIKQPLSLVLHPSLCALPANSTAHTQYTQATSSFPLGELRLVILFPLAAALLPSLPPPAGPRKRGIASNSNYRTRGYHASNLTLGRPTRARVSCSPRTFFFTRLFFARGFRKRANQYGNVDRFSRTMLNAMRRERTASPQFFSFFSSLFFLYPKEDSSVVRRWKFFRRQT